MDFQRSIVARPGAEGVVERVVGVRDRARRAGVTIGYVRVGLNETERAAVSPHNKTFSAVAGRGGMAADDPGTAIDDRLSPTPGDIVVRKVRVGAFSTTDLDDQLRRAGCDTVLLAGISTSGVVLSTVRDAADRNYRVVVLADCCVDQPEVHQFLTEQIFPRQADVITSDELPGLLG